DGHGSPGHPSPDLLEGQHFPGVRERQGPEQHRVHYAEDGGGGTDAKRQREDHRDGERRTPAERAESEANVVHAITPLVAPSWDRSAPPAGRARSWRPRQRQRGTLPRPRRWPGRWPPRRRAVSAARGF